MSRHHLSQLFSSFIPSSSVYLLVFITLSFCLLPSCFLSWTLREIPTTATYKQTINKQTHDLVSPPQVPPALDTFRDEEARLRAFRAQQSHSVSRRGAPALGWAALTAWVQIKNEKFISSVHCCLFWFIYLLNFRMDRTIEYLYFFLSRLNISISVTSPTEYLQSSNSAFWFWNHFKEFTRWKCSIWNQNVLCHFGQLMSLLSVHLSQHHSYVFSKQLL